MLLTSITVMCQNKVQGKMELRWEKRNPREKIKAGWSCPGKPCKAAHAVSCAYPPAQLGPAQRLSCREKSFCQGTRKWHWENVPELWVLSSPPRRLARGHPSSSRPAFWLTEAGRSTCPPRVRNRRKRKYREIIMGTVSSLAPVSRPD